MLRFSRFFLAVFMLVALMHLSQGETTTELPFLLERLKQSVKVGQAKIYNTVFDLMTYTTTEMSTTTMEEDDFELTNRQLIVVPNRCPSGSDLIRGSCRTRVY